jgi:superoxide reductase
MHTIGNHLQHENWKNEKHVPVIEIPEVIKPNEMFEVKVQVGKEIAHPNTTEHHIAWIRVYFMPEGEKFIYDIALFDFNAHGASTKGANEGTVYTHHAGCTQMKTGQPGRLYAVSYCNIHGLWESNLEVKFEEGML